jgi:hypothetical protein
MRGHLIEAAVPAKRTTPFAETRLAHAWRECHHGFAAGE